MKTQRYSEDDWRGLAGSTNFLNGAEPVIGEPFPMTVAGVVGVAQVIGDGHGVGVMWFDKECEETASWEISMGNEFENGAAAEKAVMAVLAALPDVLDEKVLAEFGFKSA